MRWSPQTGAIMDEGEMHGRAVGITGTGVIATIAEGLSNGLIKIASHQYI